MGCGKWNFNISKNIGLACQGEVGKILSNAGILDVENVL